MNDHETAVMSVLARANPVHDGDIVGDPARDAKVFGEVMGQRDEVAIDADAPTLVLEEFDLSRRLARRSTLAFAASLVAIVVATSALVVGLRQDDPIVDPSTVPASVVSTLPAPAAIPSTIDPLRIDRALATIDAFVRAFNGGDLDGALAVVSNDFNGTEVYGTGEARPDTDQVGDKAFVAITVARGVGAGTQLAVRDCAAADQQRPAGVTLVCRWEVSDPVVQAVDGDPAVAEALIVAGDAIVETHLGFGLPEPNTLGKPFLDWMKRYHPDAVPGLVRLPSDIEQAFELGASEADWARRWGAFLDEYECEPSEFCTITIERWVSEYDQQCLTAPEPVDVPAPALVEHMRGIPSTIETADQRRSLAEADAILAGLDPMPDDVTIPELEQRRARAMAELGIDERCRPAEL